MSDHFNIDALVKCIGCPIKLTNNMAFYGFYPIISVELKSPLQSTLCLNIKSLFSAYCTGLGMGKSDKVLSIHNIHTRTCTHTHARAKA